MQNSPTRKEDLIPVVEYHTLRFYGRITNRVITDMDQIPTQARLALSLFTHEELIRPFVYDDMREGGYTLEQLSRKYHTTIGRIRQIGRTFGFNKRYPCSIQHDFSR